jgi:hypothetical protein
MAPAAKRFHFPFLGEYQCCPQTLEALIGCLRRGWKCRIHLGPKNWVVSNPLEPQFVRSRAFRLSVTCYRLLILIAVLPRKNGSNCVHLRPNSKTLTFNNGGSGLAHVFAMIIRLYINLPSCRIGCPAEPRASRYLPRETDLPHETFLSSLKIITIGFNMLPKSLCPIEKSRMQGPVAIPQN